MSIDSTVPVKDYVSAPASLLPIGFANVRCEDESSPTISILESASKRCLSSDGEIYGGTQVASKRRKKCFNKYSGSYIGPQAASVPNVLLAIRLGRLLSLSRRRRNLFNQASDPMGVYREDGDLSVGSRNLPLSDARSTLPPTTGQHGDRMSKESQPVALLLSAPFKDVIHTVSEEGGNEYQASGETRPDTDDFKQIPTASGVSKETRAVAKARRLRSTHVGKRKPNDSRRFKRLRRYTKLARTQSVREVLDEDPTIEQEPSQTTSSGSLMLSHGATCTLSGCSGTDCIPIESPFMAYPIALLGDILERRFDRLGEISELDKAISLRARCVELTPDGHRNKPHRLCTLAIARWTRFERLGEMSDLQEVISAETRCLELAPDGHPDNPRWLNNLGISLWGRFDRLGEIGDLVQAISLSTRSVDLTPDSHPHKPLWLGNLGSALEKRFHHLGEIGDLEEAISLKTRSVYLTPDGHPDKPRRLGKLGIALGGRFDRLGEIGDLEEATSLIIRCADLTPDDHPDKPLWLGNLGIAMEKRFERLGEIDDLEEAISLKTRCVDLAPDDHPHKPHRLGDLGLALERRFHRLGEIDDLEEAISLKTRCIDLTPDGHPDKPHWLGNLGIAMEKRFDRLGEIDDLEEAISQQTRCVDLIPDDHPHKPYRLGNLGVALEKRFDRLGKLGDLEEAISLMTRCVDLIPDGHPDKAHRLNDLGGAFYARFYHTREIADLERAIQVMRSSVHFADVIDPLRIHYYLRSLSDSLQEYFISTGNSGVCPEAVKCLETIINTRSSPALGSFRAACRLAALLQLSTVDKVQDAATYDKLIIAYEHAVMLIPEIIWLGSSITRRYELLKDIADIISGTASAAIAVGSFIRAIEWVEQGRSVVWNQLLQLRNPLHELSESHPDFAKRLQAISRQLQNSSNVVEGPVTEEDKGDSRIVQQKKISTRIRLAQEYERILSTIRNLEGFKNFLKPKTYTDIAQACSNGPVIVINVSSISSDALVCLSADKIVHVRLTDFDQPTAQILADRLFSLLHNYNVRKSAPSESCLGQTSDDFDDLSQRALAIHKSTSNSITAVLGILWKRVVHPVLNAIKGKASSLVMQ